MGLNTRLATMLGAATLAMTTPAMANEKSAPDHDAHAPQAEASWYRTAWNYSGDMLGKGLSYAGIGLTKAGEGISWTFDKAMTPIRVTGEAAKKVGDTLAKGPEWVEEKTGIPMQTAASIVRAPTGFIYGITDNASDLLKDAPKAGLGMAGSTLGMVGSVISVDKDGIVNSAKDFGGHSWDMVKTGVGDALPLGLQATGVGGVMAHMPYEAIVRDGLAAAHRTADMIQGQTDLSKPIPKGAFAAVGYTYQRIAEGKESADMKQGNLFATTPEKAMAQAKDNPGVKEHKPLNPAIVKAMQGGRSG